MLKQMFYGFKCTLQLRTWIFKNDKIFQHTLTTQYFLYFENIFKLYIF